MGINKLQSRTILRNMVKMQIIATYMNDVGRQRITKYVSKKYEKKSQMSKQFNKEMRKIKKLTKQITSENEEKQKERAMAKVENKSSVQNEVDETHKKSHSDNSDDQTDVTTSVKDDDEDNTKVTLCVKTDTKFKNFFYAVNRILYKYQMLKFISKYKSPQRLSRMKTSKVDTKQKSKSNIFSNNSLQQITDDAKTKLLYSSIKMNLMPQKSVHEKGTSESFMDVVQNSENSNSSNITYRYCT